MPNVLIVDDDSVDRQKARRCLSALENLVVVEADNGEIGLASVAEAEPDLVLTDLRMPVMDGLHLVERLRQEHPLVPVILMTSQGNERIAVTALRSGAWSYVPKSEIGETLHDTVRHVLDLAEARRSQRELFRHVVSSEVHYEIPNEPRLAAAFAAHIEDGLERLGFGSETERASVSIAVDEAVSNAIVHGNLEVGSEIRRDDRDRWHALIRERSTKEPWASRRVRCTACQSRNRVTYVIEDEGRGFDRADLPDPTRPERVLEVFGRGINLIRTFMDEVDWNDAGNRLTMSKSSENPQG